MFTKQWPSQSETQSFLQKKWPELLSTIVMPNLCLSIPLCMIIFRVLTPSIGPKSHETSFSLSPRLWPKFGTC